MVKGVQIVAIAAKYADHALENFMPVTMVFMAEVEN